MSRYDLVKEFNYYTDKRNSYMDKIQANEDLISVIESGFSNCRTYVDQIGAYSGYANIFKQLHEHNDDYFNDSQKSYIIGILNEVGTHLETERANAQSEINYWYGKIEEYDREQAAQQQAGG